MSNKIPEKLTQCIRERKSLLWICQRYDLVQGATPHDYDIPPNEAILLYKQHPDELDKKITEFHWEAVWAEGALSQPIKTIQNNSKSTIKTRIPVILASEADAKAEVSSTNFLPIFSLPGLIDPAAPRSSQYGELRARTRSRIAWDLGSRIKNYIGRALVVIGAKTDDDLKLLYEILEENPIKDLSIIIVSDCDINIKTREQYAAFKIHVWQQGLLDFINELNRIGAPKAHETSKDIIRYSNKFIDISGQETGKILERFNLIAEKDHEQPTSFTMDDLIDFLDSKSANWKAFAAGVPIQRHYILQNKNTIIEEILQYVTEISTADDRNISYFIQIPSHGGSGATTFIRQIAYDLSISGYPVLMLRHDQFEFNTDHVISFANMLSEKALSLNISNPLPLIIFFDKEHSANNGTRQLHHILANQGKKAIVIQNIDASEEDNNEFTKTKRRVQLPPLPATTTDNEVHQCALHFRSISEKFQLPLNVPSNDDWGQYAKSTSWAQTQATPEDGTLFWVALRFFLTEGADLFAATNARDALGGWISKRKAKIIDKRSISGLNFLASLSSYRIACPLWTLLRPITGGSFSTDLTQSFKEIDDLVHWGGYNSDLHDQIVMFKHPILADEYLRQQDINSHKDKLNTLEPLLSSLSAGSEGDRWVAKSLARSVLAPTSDSLHPTDREWRLDGFEMIPSVIRDNDKTILHHWARCLYQCAANANAASNGSEYNSIALFKKSINTLQHAIEIPRTSGRDEHPSQLYNTLGTAYARYAEHLQQTDISNPDIPETWDLAYNAFNKSLTFSLFQDIKGLMSFSYRILKKTKSELQNTQPSEENIKELSHAMSLLDLAEDITNANTSDNKHLDEINSSRLQILSILDTQKAQEKIDALIKSDDPELGYICKARIIASDHSNKDAINESIELLTYAQSKKYIHHAQTIKYLIHLMQRSEKYRTHFTKLYDLYKTAETSFDNNDSPIDLFRKAVLCYQTERFDEGKDIFRTLRSVTRRSDFSPPHIRDYWRNDNAPFHPRVTSIKINKYVSEWRAEGYVDDLRQPVPLRPRHFSPSPKLHEITPCIIRFEINGPLAVPQRFSHDKHGRP